MLNGSTGEWFLVPYLRIEVRALLTSSRKACKTSFRSLTWANYVGLWRDDTKLCLVYAYPCLDGKLPENTTPGC
jgi:hypothetical protein